MEDKGPSTDQVTPAFDQSTHLNDLLREGEVAGKGSTQNHLEAKENSLSCEMEAGSPNPNSKEPSKVKIEDDDEKKTNVFDLKLSPSKKRRSRLVKQSDKTGQSLTNGRIVIENSNTIIAKNTVKKPKNRKLLKRMG